MVTIHRLKTNRVYIEKLRPDDTFYGTYKITPLNELDDSYGDIKMMKKNINIRDINVPYLLDEVYPD